MIAFIFMQIAPSETGPYLILGYVAMFLIGAVYVASLWSRQRNLHKDLQLMQRLLEEDDEPEMEPDVPVNR